MPLKIYTMDQRREWDAIVRSFSSYDVYWLSGYVKAFQIHGDGEPMLFSYEGKKIRGINVVMKRDINKDLRFLGKIEEDGWFDIATPYGYGGWLIEGAGEREELFQVYENWCRNNHIVAEFVRYHPLIKNYKCTTSAYDVLKLGETIAMDLSSPEIIWENLTSKNRNMIRKAQKAGVVIYNGRYPDIFRKFRVTYSSTMDKVKADAYYYFEDAFYESILRDLSAEGQVFYAELDGIVVAASIILAANGHLNYHLSGSLKEYQNLAPSNLLLYEAALWGNANGCKTFHLGGGVGCHEDNLYKFKRAFFRGEPYYFCIGKKIFIKDKYDELVNIRKTCEDDFNDNTGYFPKYRG